jgi:hypothetical protein
MKVKAGWLDKVCDNPHSIIIEDDSERIVVIPIQKAKSIVLSMKAVMMDYLDSDAFQEKL